MALNTIRGTRKPPRIVLAGPPKIGKSTMGANADKPVFVTTEDGIDNLPVDQYPVAESWEKLLANLREVATEDHDRKTLVLDTLNGAVELAAQQICTDQFGGEWIAKKGQGGFNAYGQGWKSTSEEIRKLLALLDECRGRGMIILLLAHIGLHNVKSPIEGEYTKFAPDIDKSVWARISKWSDIILRAEYEHVVLKADNKGKGRAVGGSVRRLYCRGTAAEDGGCRVGYELPEEMDLSWEALSESLGTPTATLDEAKALWGVLNADEQKKALTWLHVTKLEDAPLTKMRQLVNRLREKQAAAQTEEEK